MNLSCTAIKIILVIFLLLTQFLLGQPAFAAPKKAVSQFSVDLITVKGVQSHPEKGISPQSVNEFANQVLNDLLLKLESEQSADKKTNRKLTLDDLHDIAYQISRFYQNKGFSFVSAYVPRQKIRNSHVVIEVREDKLADIQIRNTNEATEDDIREELLHLIGHPVYKPDLEESILLLNDHPNRNLFAYFSRGNHQGETRLNVNVQHAGTTVAALTADNYGTDSTGKNRVTAAASLRDALGFNDIIHFQLTQSTDIPENKTGSISYEKFIGSRNALTFSFFQNQYQLGEDLKALELEGEYQSLRIDLRHKSKRSLKEAGSHLFFMESRASKLESKVSPEIIDQKEETSSIGYQYASTDHEVFMGDYFSQGWQISAIHLQEPEESNLDEELFAKANLDFYAGLSIGQYIPGLSTRFKSRVSLQLTPDALPSSDKTSLTGQAAVRAFQPGTFGADKSGVIQLQLGTQFSLWQSRCELYALYDFAQGSRTVGADQVDAKLSGYGVGFDLTFGKSLTLNTVLAQPLMSEIGELELDKDINFLAQLKLSIGD